MMHERPLLWPLLQTAWGTVSRGANLNLVSGDVSHQSLGLYAHVEAIISEKHNINHEL